MASDFKMAIAYSTAGYNSSPVDVTTTDLGGDTPKAAIIFTSLATATAGGTPATLANSLLSIGFATDDTGSSPDKIQNAYISENNVGTENTAKYWTGNSLGKLIDFAGNQFANISDFSFITNGIRLTIDDTYLGTNQITAILISGASVEETHIRQAIHTAVNSEQNINNVGFKPDIVFCLTDSNSSVSSSSNTGGLIFGIATESDGITKQYCIGQTISAETGNNNFYSSLSNTRIGAAELATGGSASTLEIGNFDSLGFSTWQRGDTTPNQFLRYATLSIKLKDDVKAVLHDDTITVTGNKTIFTPGISPENFFVISNGMSTWNTNISTDQAENPMWAIVDTNNDNWITTGVLAEHNASTTITHTKIYNKYLVGTKYHIVNLYKSGISQFTKLRAEITKTNPGSYNLNTASISALPCTIVVLAIGPKAVGGALFFGTNF